ncbi:YceI family protein [Bermanella sp. R86510]|uniref:YceI family protein n=1 Tax=unclassified Bermanella TaxID=2627862 RepID=UPI0037C8CC91
MRILTLCLACFISTQALADWTLSEPSHVYFVSTKNNAIAEVNHFKAISGDVSDDGTATLKIDLSSVDTGIDIRDERINKHLFNTEKYTHATFTSNIPTDVLKKAEKGQSFSLQLSGSLKLHGESQTISTAVSITSAKDGRIRVNSIEPVLIKADDFALAKGINKLREIAGLDSIVTTVPVTFSLLFTAQ